MVSALDRKLLRDLLTLRGQVVTIALVVACGISSYVTMRSAYDSLVFSRDQYYREFRFADMFAALKCAPMAARRELESIPGVQRVETRVMEQALVPLADQPRPASGTVVSVDGERRGHALNDIYLKRGRYLDPNHRDEVLLLDGFAEAHQIGPGDRIKAVINGKLRSLRVVGTALSPEYVMPIAPGEMTYDPSAVPVLWMSQEVLEALFNMKGAFNHAIFTLERGADVAAVRARVDAVLQRYGGFGAIARDKQASNYVLSGELQQLNSMANFVPYLFLFVAALLVNVVLSRLVQLQRAAIATLKAVGYPDRAIGFHYLKLVCVIVLLGAVLGVILGAWLGSALTELYTSRFFRFPDARYRLEARALVFSVGVSFGSAILGAWWAVKSVQALPPAEAMRPPAPARYRKSVLERLGFWNWFAPEFRMVWRELSRRPLRLLLSAVGIALAVGILVVARSMSDSIEYLLEVQFHRSMREDINVTFAEPVQDRAIAELGHISGVVLAEGMRVVPVRFRVGHRTRDSALVGYQETRQLRRLLDDRAREHEVPPEGVLLTQKLGELLEVRVGDWIWVDVREGDWRTERIRVAGFLAEPFGLAGHMDRRALSRLLNDTGPVTTALLVVDSQRSVHVERRLKQLPAVVAVSSPRDFKTHFKEQSGAMMGLFTLIFALFASTIAIGVIYNNARVAFSQRTRDLGTLRVLGFTHREIATILFGEQAVQVALAVPIGLLVGRWLSRAMMSTTDPEAYRMPVVVSTQTYLFAVAVTVASALMSALLLRRKLAKLDLIGVLKTRE